MSGLALAPRTRTTVTGLFVLFLLVNVFFLTMAFMAASGTTVPFWMRLQDDAPLGWRLLLLIIGAVGSWFSARTLYKMLVNGGVPPSDSVGPALSLVSYLALVLAAYAFFSFAAWVWLPLLFLIVLVWSVIALWSLVGAVPVVTAICIAIAGGALAWFVLA